MLTDCGIVLGNVGRWLAQSVFSGGAIWGTTTKFCYTIVLFVLAVKWFH